MHMPGGVLRRYLGLTTLFAGLLVAFACLTFLATDRPFAAVTALLGGIGLALLGIRLLARARGPGNTAGP